MLDPGSRKIAAMLLSTISRRAFSMRACRSSSLIGATVAPAFRPVFWAAATTADRVTCRTDWPDQVRAGQRGQQPARLSHGRAHQRGTGVGLDIDARVQPEQAERARGVAVKVLIRP